MRFQVGDTVKMAKYTEALSTTTFSFLRNIEGVIMELNYRDLSDPIRIEWEHPKNKEYVFSHREDELRLVRRG